MAAVIRYLSADNHTADTLPFSSPEAGRHCVTMSVLHGPVFETSVCFTFLPIQYYFCVCACVYTYYK